MRSLGRAGFEVVLGCQEAESSTALSRYVGAVRLFEGLPPRRFYDRLEACVRRDRPAFVFPVGETQLRRLLQDPQRIAPFARLTTWVMPEAETVARCFDKRAMYRLAAILGIPAPAWRTFAGTADWLQAADELGFPLVIKRKDSSAMVRTKKALILRNAGELERVLGEVACDPDPDSLLLQKHAPGTRRNCHVAASRGRMVAYFEQKVLRTDEPDETGIGIEGVSVPPSPQLRAYCEKMLGTLEYTGIGCIQFLVDERSGEIAFLEFNPRMDSTAALPYRLGFDFPLIAVDIAAGKPAKVPPAYAVGRRYYWLYGDVNAWLARRGSEPLGRTLISLFKMPWAALRGHDLAFEWRDPLPTLHQFWKKAVDSARKLAQRGARKPSVEPGSRLQR